MGGCDTNAIQQLNAALGGVIAGTEQVNNGQVGNSQAATAGAAVDPNGGPPLGVPPGHWRFGQLTEEQIAALKDLWDKFQAGELTQDEFCAAVWQILPPRPCGPPLPPIDLTEDQKTQAEAIFQDAHGQVVTLTTKARADVLALLTPEQQAALEQLAQNWPGHGGWHGDPNGVDPNDQGDPNDGQGNDGAGPGHGHGQGHGPGGPPFGHGPRGRASGMNGGPGGGSFPFPLMMLCPPPEDPNCPPPAIVPLPPCPPRWHGEPNEPNEPNDPNSDPNHPCGPPFGHGPGFFGPHFGPPPLCMNERVIAALGLTADQVTAITAIHEALRAALKQVHDEAWAAFLALLTPEQIDQLNNLPPPGPPWGHGDGRGPWGDRPRGFGPPWGHGDGRGRSQ